MIRGRNLKICRCEGGSSLVEFSIITGSLFAVGLFVLQIGLLYHAKTTVNYAVFEAARIGAVNNASIKSIRAELGRRLAPLEGGDGTAPKAAAAIAKSAVRVGDPVNTRIDILNPTRDAFRDWAVIDSVTGRRVIPVSHLRHQSYSVGVQSGLSLRDATLLKIRVTHGVELRVPFVGTLMTNTMTLFDPQNAQFYVRNMWPLQAVAIVRMQSDAYEEYVLGANETSESDGSETEQVGVNDEWNTSTTDRDLFTEFDQEPDSEAELQDAEQNDSATDIATHCDTDADTIRPFVQIANPTRPIAGGSLAESGRPGTTSGLIRTSTIRDWIRNRG